MSHPGTMANSRPLIDHRIEDGVDVLYLNGVWRLANIVPITAALQRVRLAHGARCVLDGGQLEAMDTAAGFQLFRHLAAGG